MKPSPPLLPPWLHVRRRLPYRAAFQAQAEAAVASLQYQQHAAISQCNRMLQDLGVG